MNLLSMVLKRFGLVAFPRLAGYHYVPDFYGRAAAKSIDIRTLPEFGPLAAEVIGQGRTLLYYDRLYTIYQAIVRVSQSPEVMQSKMAEVGVYKGGGSYFIASVLGARRLEAVPLYCFDTFEGHDFEDIKEEDPYQRASVFNDTSFESVKAYLAGFSNVRILKGRFQNTSKNIDADKFSFVHLDMDLYEPTVYGLNFFAPRLFPAGVILVDDYGFVTCPGVKRAVDEFVSGNPGYFGIHLLTGQYILVRR